MAKENHTNSIISALIEQYTEPKKDKTISLRLSKRTYNKLIDMCTELDVSPSELIRQLLENHFKLWRKE